MKWLLAIMMSLLLVGCTSSAARGQSQLAKDGETFVAQTAMFLSPSKPKADVKADVLSDVVFQKEQSTIEVLLGTKPVAVTLLEEQSLLYEQELLRLEQIETNKNRIENLIEKVKEKYVGNVWYVFSGSTPSGWDCSGFTMWFYDKLGVELEHRATLQKHDTDGKAVKDPKVGDLVAFSYGQKNWWAYHVGVYVGNGKMLHSGGKRGDRTSVVSIEKFGGNYSEVTYVRFIETP
jgi:cell wall-associated NlpC family hydrolase